MTFNRRWIIGKTVTHVDMRPFEAGDLHRRGMAHNPRIYFNDGSSITFTTEETDVGEYGTQINYLPAPKAVKP